MPGGSVTRTRGRSRTSPRARAAARAAWARRPPPSGGRPGPARCSAVAKPPLVGRTPRTCSVSQLVAPGRPAVAEADVVAEVAVRAQVRVEVVPGPVRVVALPERGGALVEHRPPVRAHHAQRVGVAPGQAEGIQDVVAIVRGDDAVVVRRHARLVPGGAVRAQDVPPDRRRLRGRGRPRSRPPSRSPGAARRRSGRSAGTAGPQCRRDSRPGRVLVGVGRVAHRAQQEDGLVRRLDVEQVRGRQGERAVAVEAGRPVHERPLAALVDEDAPVIELALHVRQQREQGQVLLLQEGVVAEVPVEVGQAAESRRTSSRGCR